MFTFVKYGTSGGIISGPSITHVDEGITYRMRNSGEKAFMIEACVREFHRIMMKICKGEKVRFQPCCVIKMKGEFKLALWKKMEDIMKMQWKSRFFFIPDPMQIFLSSLMGEARMNFERGKVIKIGFSPYYGGMYELAVQMNYDNEDIFWVDGDIEGLDKQIKDYILYLYIAAMSRYYNWSGMNHSQTKVITKLLKMLMYHISNKVVLHVGTFWRFMRGIMYSGGKETSHGDSWVMAFCFFLYINHVMTIVPHLADVIAECVRKGFIAIIVYGDDHIWCCPKKLRLVINATGFADFLRLFVHMVLRDYREYDSFLSIPNLETGELDEKKKGPRFLKRYFILSNDPNMAPVVGYKPLYEPMIKLFLDRDGFKENYLLKCVSAAWDTMGTNPVHYELITMAYHMLYAMSPRTPMEMIEECVRNREGALMINKLIRRCGMTIAQMFDHYPTLSELRRRNKYIPEECAFGNRADWEFDVVRNSEFLQRWADMPW